VLHRQIKNQRPAAVGYLAAFSAITALPGGRNHYDKPRASGDRHAATERNLFSRLLGCLHHCLHHCLATGQHCDENSAFPPPSPADQAIAA